MVVHAWNPSFQGTEPILSPGVCNQHRLYFDSMACLSYVVILALKSHKLIIFSFISTYLCNIMIQCKKLAHAQNTSTYSFSPSPCTPFIFLVSDSFIYLVRIYEVNYLTHRLKTRLIGLRKHSTQENCTNTR